jgi:tRNA (adenine37-N6)-methyltransferase
MARCRFLGTEFRKKNTMTELILTPIGYLNCNQIYNYDAPRQAVLAEKNEGIITLQENCNYEQALSDLKGFDKIWLIYHLHKNKGWRTKTLPPRSIDGTKKGVFATRSPYRPNPIGLSCVDLIKIEGRKLYIKSFDLLDKTPILDIKPYIPYCDSFPDSSAGWLDDIKESDNWNCTFADNSKKQIKWIKENSKFDLERFCQIQLNNDPLNTQKKRVKLIDETMNLYCLSYRTWRIYFEVFKAQSLLKIIDIDSGYSSADLLNKSIDKYNDKKLHCSFKKLFKNN